MKALLYKDAMVLWKQMKLMLLLILIFAVIPSEFQNTFAVLYAALLPYSALAYDERSRWDRMAAAMPSISGWASGPRASTRSFSYTAFVDTEIWGFASTTWHWGAGGSSVRISPIPSDRAVPLRIQ